MSRRIIQSLAAAVFATFVIETASAALVGDTISVDFRSPDINTIATLGNPNSVTVVDGASDSVVIEGLLYDAIVNPENTRIIIDFANGSGRFPFISAQFLGVVYKWN